MNPTGQIIATAREIGKCEHADTIRQVVPRIRNRVTLGLVEFVEKRDLTGPMSDDERATFDALLIAFAVLPEDAEPYARCRECSLVFDLPSVKCECPRCGGSYIERVVI